MEGGGLGFEEGWARACAPERSNVRSIERWGSNEASAAVALDVLVMPFPEINGGRNEGVSPLARMTERKTPYAKIIVVAALALLRAYSPARFSSLREVSKAIGRASSSSMSGPIR